MDTTQQQSTNQTRMFNDGFINESALQMRLGTDELMAKIELFLRGKQKVIEPDANGKAVLKIIKMGEEKANNIGVQTLLSRVTAVVNSSTAQGYITRDWYFDKIAEFRESLTDDLVLNSEKWGIIDSDLNDIIDMICDLVELFITRPIDNKERDSYSNTIRTNETSSLQGSENPQLLKK